MSDQVLKLFGPILHPRVALPLTLLFLAAVVLGITTLAPRVAPPDATVPVVEPVVLPEREQVSSGDGFVLDAGYLAGQFDLVVDMKRPDPAETGDEPGIGEGGVVTDEPEDEGQSIEFVGMIEDFRGLTAVLRIDGQQRWIRQGAERDGVSVVGVGENAARIEVDGVPRVIEKSEPTGAVVGEVATPLSSPSTSSAADANRASRIQSTSAAEDRARRRAWSRDAQRDLRRAREAQGQEADRDGQEAGER